MTEYDLGKVVGDNGDDGVGIASITKTGTSGLVDTYTITYTDGDTDTFTVTNGSDASVTIVTSFSGTTSDSKVPSEKLTKTELDKKIATSSTSGLVKNDGSIMTSGTGASNWAVGNHTHSAYVNPTKVTSWSSTPSDSNVASEKLIKDSLDDKVSKSSTSGLLKNDGTVDTTSYSTFSGSYSDLSNKPSIPSASSDLSDGSDLVKKSQTSGLLKNDGSVMTGGTGSSNWAIGNHSHSGYVSATKVTSWSSTVSDSNVPSEKLVKNSLDDKISKSSTSGLVKNDGSVDTSSYITSSAISGMLTSSDIANNLTTTTTGKVLDATQGKALKDLIGDAITYINQ